MGARLCVWDAWPFPAACAFPLKIIFSISILIAVLLFVVPKLLRQYPPPRDTRTLARAQGLECEEHSVTTRDGYVITMHRIVSARRVSFRLRRRQALSDTNSLSDEDLPITNQKGSSTGTPILLLHGAMLSSEIWLAHPTHNLAVSLARSGYDVWLANRRGNRYAAKHIKLDPASDDFWAFSIDDSATLDVPAQASHVLAVTGASKLALVGFSQGTTEAFCALSAVPALRKRVAGVVALAATACPGSLSSPLLRAMLRRSPELLYAALGRKAAFGSFAAAQRSCTAPVLRAILDVTMSHLFAWRGTKIPPSVRNAVYQHMHSPTSVMQLVHWFQILAACRLQTFRPNAASVPRPYSLAALSAVPIAAFIGGRDSLANAEDLHKMLPKTATIVSVPDYEHMDLLWAEDAHLSVHVSVAHFLSSLPV